MREFDSVTYRDERPAIGPKVLGAGAEVRTKFSGGVPGRVQYVCTTTKEGPLHLCRILANASLPSGLLHTVFRIQLVTAIAKVE